VLAQGRQVIAVDLQGHGRTADIDRPLDVELMADDIAALAGQLRNDRIDIMGYSLGGLVALQTAIRHPNLVRKLVAVSTPFRRRAVYAERLVQTQPAHLVAESMKQTPIYEMYRAVAPTPEDWPVLVTKLFAAMTKEFDYSAAVRHIKAATLIACADADIFPPSLCGRIFCIARRRTGRSGMGRRGAADG
jgi:pimeloyl-ACP methyl ester carboxylesterase